MPMYESLGRILAPLKSDGRDNDFSEEKRIRGDWAQAETVERHDGGTSLRWVGRWTPVAFIGLDPLLACKA